MSTNSAPFIKVGDRLSNNDPRVAAIEAKKIVTVTETNVWVSHGSKPGVAYHTGKRRATIAYERIFVDRKPRHQGYNWIG